MIGSYFKLLLKQSLKKHEGFRQFPYRCSAGKLTIGIGRNLEANGISEYEAEILLESDINKCESLLQTLEWYNKLEESKQIIIIELCFNIGFTGLLQFKKMIEAIKNRNWKLASQELLDSKYSKDVGQRAIDLANAMRT